LTAAYIGLYAKRPTLSKIRIKSYTGEYISFEFKDYRDDESKVLYTLKTIDFLRKQEVIFRRITLMSYDIMNFLPAGLNRHTKRITNKFLGKALGVINKHF